MQKSKSNCKHRPRITVESMFQVDYIQVTLITAAKDCFQQLLSSIPQTPSPATAIVFSRTMISFSFLLPPKLRCKFPYPLLASRKL